MAIQTFGSTLTDLQAGLNTAEGIDAQRYAAYLQARSEEQRTRAQREAALAKIIEDRNIRQQQGQQFDVNQRNLMDAARLDAQTREKVAEIQAKSRGVDPRFAQTIADIQFQNNEKQNEIANFKKLSDQRKLLVAERARIKANQKWFFPSSRGGSPNDPLFDFGQPDDPRWAQLNTLIAGLDAQASQLGLPVGPDEGYVIPEFTPVPIPAILNQQASPASAPVVSQATPDLGGYLPAVDAPPAATASTRLLTPEEAALLPNGTLYRGLDGRQRRRTVAPPASPLPAIAPATPPTASPWDTRSQLRRMGRLPAATSAPTMPTPQPEGQWVMENGRYVFKENDPRLNFNLGDFLRQYQSFSPQPNF